MSACPAPIPSAPSHLGQYGRWNPKAEGLRRLGLFNPLPHWLAIRRFWRDPQGNIRKVNPSAKLCYATLLRICGPDGSVTASLAKLAFDQGLTWRQAHRVLCDLEAMGLIVRIQRGNNLANQYEFCAHEWMLGELEVFAAPTPIKARVRPPPRRQSALQADLPGLFPERVARAEMSRRASSFTNPVLTLTVGGLPEMSVPSNMEVKNNGK